MVAYDIIMQSVCCCEDLVITETVKVHIFLHGYYFVLKCVSPYGFFSIVYFGNLYVVRGKRHII
jgi:hypothetical protein